MSSWTDYQDDICDAQKRHYGNATALHLALIGLCIDGRAALALRAQPPAREDAQPVACVSCEDRPASGNNPCASCGRTHPAPDALRVAVEALEAINHIRSEMVGVPVDSEAANAWAMALDAAADHARQALAALQAEQKGGA